MMMSLQKYLHLLKKILHLIVYSRGKYFRYNMIPPTCGEFYINNKLFKLSGDFYASMLDEIVFRDAYMLKNLSRESINTVVDVGANIGIFSLWASSCFPKSFIYSLEPNKNLCKIFNNNLSNVSNYKLLGIALSDKDRIGRLDISKEHTESFLLDETEINSNEGELCKILSLDSFVSMIDKNIDLLKLDCEGAEYDIIISKEIRNIKYIVGELHTTQKNKPADAISHLKYNDFTVVYNPFNDGRAGIFFAKNNSVIL